jgi:hypothetical protein
VQFNTAIHDDTGGYPQEPFVFMHEFAHLMGANHNAEDSNNTTPLESGAYGHWAVHAKDGSLRTILSNPTAQCSGGGACTRIMNYSNPDVVVDWFRTGVANAADNAQLIADWWSYPTTYRVS